MRILLTGGSANGKSTYAETLAVRCGGPLYYIAAMQPYGEESQQRIRRHRRMRAEKGFTTIECYTNLLGLRLPTRGTVLLECLCNLTANEMFDPCGAGKRAEHAILEGVAHLGRQCENLIIVTNDVSSDGGGYSAQTMEYVRILSRLNQVLALQFDRVEELVCGVPLLLALPIAAKDRDDRKGADGTMLLVVGGVASGKRSYIASLGYGQQDIADGVLNEKPVLLNLQSLVSANPGHCMEWLPLLLQKKVVSCCEVGSGVIPLAREAREAREETGRLCCALAKQADRMVRMVSGIPIVIKESKG